jgi:hypothetical protein
MKTTEEKALRAIIRAGEARRIYQYSKELLGKQQQIFTQVDVMSPSNDVSSPLITLTQQTDIEREILSRSRCHSLQSYHTPFLSNPLLHGAISLEAGTNKLDRILDGSFFMDEAPSMGLNENQKQWIYEL